MNDHNLDDLIIGTPGQKGGKTKGLLTIIALFIVVLIVGIILTKIILKNPENQRAEFENNDTEMISPELTLQDAVDDDEAEDKDGQMLSDMIKSEMETPQKTESTDATVKEVAKETIAIDETHSTESTQEKPAVVSSKNSTTPTPSETKTTPATEGGIQEKPAVVSSKNSATPSETKTSQPKTTPVTDRAPQKVVKTQPSQPHPKTATKNTQKTKPVPSKTVSRQYYIQVGSFSKTPSKDSHLINALRKQRFRYRVMKLNHMNKVLIGPYGSRAEADKAIIRVKDLINKYAFVVQR